MSESTEMYLLTIYKLNHESKDFKLSLQMLVRPLLCEYEARAQPARSK